MVFPFKLESATLIGESFAPKSASKGDSRTIGSSASERVFHASQSL
jgi:hypothetical protein